MPKEKDYIHNAEVAMVINFDSGAKGAKLAREYKEFLHNIVKNDKIWILYDDGRISIVETEEGICTPLWSSREKAEKSRVEEWRIFDVESLTVAEFLSLCIPDLLEGGLDILVEMHDGEGIHRELLTLEEDIYEEAARQGIDLAEKCQEYDNFLDANEVYEWFIEDVIEEGGVWILTDEEGDTVFADVEEEEALPVWTTEGEALVMCEEEWDHCEPEKIEISDFLEDWIPMLEKAEINVMFAVDEEGGMGTSAAIVAKDLRNAVAEMELLRPKFDNVVQFPGNKGK